MLGRLRPGVQQVGPDRVVVQVRVLGDDADHVVQRLQRDVPDVGAADPDGAAGRVIQPDTRWVIVVLPGAGRPDQRGQLARRRDGS